MPSTHVQNVLRQLRQIFNAEVVQNQFVTDLKNKALLLPCNLGYWYDVRFRTDMMSTQIYIRIH